MDNKVTLTAAQIEDLKYFIRTRGFVEPVQIQEILDHFACKVEELLEKDSSLTFPQAMQQAHHSFGISGFRPIIKELEEGLRRKYRTIYLQTIKNKLLSFKWLPLIVLSGVFGFKFMEWTELSGLNNDWELNVGTWAMFVLFALSRIILAALTGTIRSGEMNYYLKFGNFWGGTIPFFAFLSVSHHPIKHLTVVNIFVGFCFMYLLLHTLASYKAIQAAMKDYEDFTDMENRRISAVK